MSKIKLEVGKTYINREGEEVKITSCDGGYSHPYRGSDGQWYAENGKWGYDSQEFPADLIEEAPETRHTFTIPDGTKGINVSKEGNRIVVEMVPEKEPKPEPGDVMVNENGSVYIFKEVVGYGNHNYYARVGKSGRLSFEWTCNSGRPATPEEVQPLWDALKKAGKRWNAETMQVEDVPEEEPKPGDVLVNEQGSVYIFQSVRGNGEFHNHYAWLGENGMLSMLGLCYPGRPATPEEAQPLFDALERAGDRKSVV